MPKRSISAKEREILVGEAFADRPGRFEIGVGGLFDGCDAHAQTAPKGLRCGVGNEVMNEAPRLDEYVVTGDKRLVLCQQPFRASVVAVAPVGCGIPGRRVHEDAHAERLRVADPTASATMRSLSAAMSVPTDAPRSKTMERSMVRGDSAKSRSTKRRMYSANETPSAADRARTRACNSEVSDICVRTIIMAPAYRCHHAASKGRYGSD